MPPTSESLEVLVRSELGPARTSFEWALGAEPGNLATNPQKQVNVEATISVMQIYYFIFL